jgi:AraC-like DNA-binding protein
MNQKVRFDAKSPSAWWFLARRANYQVPRMAAAAGVGVPQLRRRCRQFWGESLDSWLRDQRLLAASQLLAEGWQIKAAAGRLGFRSSTHCQRLRENRQNLPI